eukprot:TRINITY_DN2075_c0_g1_i2.p1 TRINITY_DN2075_c0_g1~~TRINITY_DN2075_c0_g1_i2.p1  ORF type:complete len:420 (+),score=119.68 TRINITY_DN2075_c0_g1_i2:124-1260(+)
MEALHVMESGGAKVSMRLRGDVGDIDLAPHMDEEVSAIGLCAGDELFLEVVKGKREPAHLRDGKLNTADYVTSLCVTPCGKWLYTGLENSEVLAWFAPTGRLFGKDTCTGMVKQIVAYDDEKWYAALDARDVVTVFKFGLWRAVFETPGCSVAVSNGEDEYLYVGGKACITVFRTEGWLPIHTLDTVTYPTALSVSPRGEYLFQLGMNGISVWRTSDWQLHRQGDRPRGSVSCASPCGTMLLCANVMSGRVEILRASPKSTDNMRVAGFTVDLPSDSMGYIGLGGMAVSSCGRKLYVCTSVGVSTYGLDTLRLEGFATCATLGTNCIRDIATVGNQVIIATGTSFVVCPAADLQRQSGSSNPRAFSTNNSTCSGCVVS